MKTEPVRPMVRPSRYPFLTGTAIVVIAVLLIVAVASRRGPVSPPTPSGTPRAPVSGVPSSPAPVLEAGSEGLSGSLTTPMPAMHVPTGWATWYDDGSGYYGAVHTWRFGRDPFAVQVCLADRPGTCTHVVVRDFCACGHRHGEPTVIDLSPAAFRELAPLSRGVIRVTVSGRIDIPLPPTDTP